ncbi:hypothetical protein DFH08DRAFT_802035 [Mycena albidolilacea]|uniref:Uncharacterized protein n=1 Tax=Mycena albidolilacea TaxID=1033008 RepID=A0AAD7AGM8_9AGAR|nr:hypothetical protein DFH08DRAFT_802035 [Mycena albidolilacea]
MRRYTSAHAFIYRNATMSEEAHAPSLKTDVAATFQVAAEGVRCTSRSTLFTLRRSTPRAMQVRVLAQIPTGSTRAYVQERRNKIKGLNLGQTRNVSRREDEEDKQAITGTSAVAAREALPIERRVGCEEQPGDAHHVRFPHPHLHLPSRPLLPLILDAAEAVSRSSDTCAALPLLLPLPLLFPLLHPAPHARGRFRVGEPRARSASPCAWRMARSSCMQRSRRASPVAGERDDGKMDGRGSGRGCGRGTAKVGLAPERCRGPIWGTLSALRSPLSATYPRAPVCDMPCAGRGSPPTLTITSTRDAGQSHSPPRTRADDPPRVYVRPREEADAAETSGATASDFLPAPSPPALGAVPCGKDANAKGLLVAGPRAGYLVGGGDRLIFALLEWE